MPYADRAGLRARPLEHAVTVEFPVSDESSIKLYAAPGYMLFIERMWHGDYQQIPVDPDEEIEHLIDALQEAQRFLAERKAEERASA